MNKQNKQPYTYQYYLHYSDHPITGYVNYPFRYRLRLAIKAMTTVIITAAVLYGSVWWLNPHN